MKTKLLFFAPGIVVFGLSMVACRPAAANLQQASAPPSPPVYAQAPTPPPDSPPPPPPPRGRRPAPLPACGPGAPPPARAAVYTQVPVTTVRGSIRQFNYGPEGEVSGFLFANGTQVNFAPDAGEQIANLARVKSEVAVAGYQRQSTTGKTILDAITVTADGETVAVPAGPPQPLNAPPPPPPPANGPEPGPPQN
jgi:hypothetical protein